MVVSSLFPLSSRSGAFACLYIGLIVGVVLLGSLSSPLFEHWFSLQLLLLFWLLLFNDLLLSWGAIDKFTSEPGKKVIDVEP